MPVTDRHLALLRHAKSSWQLGPERDHERPLDERGQRAAAVVGTYIAQSGLVPDLVLCSTAKRARETLDAVLARLDARPEIRFERALYLAPAEAIGARLRRVGGGWREVLVVGHNPGLQAFAAGLARLADPGRAARITDKFPTCALVRFSLELTRWRELRPEAVRAVELVVPKDLV